MKTKDASPSVSALRKAVREGRVRVEDAPLVSVLARAVDAARAEALKRRQRKWRQKKWRER